jgi:hypothetical protein
MKNFFTVIIFCSAFIANAQRTMFAGNNNYVKPVVSSQSSAAVTNGLVLHLDASNSSSYPGSGTSWDNLVTGNAVTNFTLNGNVTYNAANGGVLRFADGGLASTSNSLGRFTKYSIETWVKLAGTSGSYPCLFTESVNQGIGGANMILGYNTGFGAANQYSSGFNSSSWNVFTTTSNTSDVNNWVQIVATYDGNSCTIYKNGIAIGTGTIGSSGINSANLGYNIGKRWDQSNYAYGDYAIVKLYNRDLSSSEVATNYNALKSRFGLYVVTDALALYLDAANPDSYTANSAIWTDLSGNNNNAALVGSTTFSLANQGSLVFSGSNYGEISNPTSNLIFGTSDFTISWWQKASSSNNNTRLFGNLSNNGWASGNWVMGQNVSSANIIELYVNPGFVIGATTIAQTWQNIVITRTGNKYNIYLNNNLISTTTSTTSLDNDVLRSFYIGSSGWPGDSGTKWIGNIASISIYKKSLSSAERLQNYNLFKSRFGL